MKRLLLVICFLATACASAALGAPDVVPGRFVYTIPQGFDPPLIGRAGVARIQHAARQLHFPYYVVLVESFNGETDDDTARYIDNLAQQWQQDPDFNAAKSSIFMLSYNPRKYRFIAGSFWEHELGFAREAHAPFTAIFVKYVSSSRKDPTTGIIRMMQAVDRYFVVESDPKTIAARKEAARKAELARQEALRQAEIARKKAEEARALQSARDQLNNEVVTLDELLASEPRFLPANADEYRAERENANVIVQLTDRNQILAGAAALRMKNDSLRTYIEAKQREAQNRQLKLLGQSAAAFVAAVVLIALLVMRFRTYTRLKRAVDRQCTEWETAISNAQPKYLSFDEERGMIAGLKDLTGRTKEVYDSATREVDDIFIAIGAMLNHINECRGMAKSGSFLRLGPLKRAFDNLDREFVADTKQLADVRLFAPDTRQVTLKPSEAMRQLEERFGRAIAQWNHLKQASEIRFKKAEEVFTQTRLDELIKTADENGIPHRWLSDHPLFGDDTSDQALYTRVNQGRMDDPVAFLEQLEGLQAGEAEVAGRLNRLVEAVQVSKSSRVETVPDLSMTVLQPQDDPAVTFDAARREEARFTALLQSRDDVTEVEQQAEAVRDLYRKCVEQAVMAQQAVEQARQELDQARKRLADVSVQGQEAEQMVREREPVFAGMQGSRSSLANGRRYLDAGKTDLDSAESLLAQRRHLEASAGARQAVNQLASAEREFGECREQCQDLDRTKQEFEEKLADMENRQEQYERRLRRYGRRARLHGFDYKPSPGALDYYLLLRQMDDLESEWKREVRQAQVIYEEEERRRREREEEERRSSWSSSSFSSSSSGSSWGSSRSSSSSGGSWGGSSSSSKSSSSGGSW